MSDFTSTVIIFGIIALIALVVLVRSFLKFIRLGKEDKVPTQALRLNVPPPKSRPRSVAPVATTAAGAKTEVGAKVETKTEGPKPVAKPDKAPDKVKTEKTERPPMPPIKVQGPSEETNEVIDRIERILIEHFKDRPGV